MAKLKPARRKGKAGPQPGAISCIVLIVLGFALLGFLFLLVIRSAS